jgi:hypothetical protein
VSDKTGWEGRDQQLGGSHGHSLDPVPSPGPGKENDYALESLDGYIVWCCWELKRKFRLTRLRFETEPGTGKRTFRNINDAIRISHCALKPDYTGGLRGPVYRNQCCPYTLVTPL